MTADPNTPADKPARLAGEAADLWRSLPDKPLFFALLATWVLLFHFLGNSTFGYKDTPSLFSWMNYAYSNSADDEHGYLVPFVVLALLVWKRNELTPLPKSPWWPALSLVVLGLLIHIVGFVVQQTRLSIVAFFVGLYGLSGLVWGRQWLKATFFPCYLFIFSFPLGTLAESITFPLRLMATKITVALAHFPLGIEVLSNGTSIWDPGGRYQYEVAAACSGLRSLTAILALAMIYGFMQFQTSWPRLVLVLSAFPLAVFGNVVRLATIIFAAEGFNQSAGNYVHRSWLLSLLPYVPAILGLIILGRLLDRRVVRPAAALEIKPV